MIPEFLVILTNCISDYWIVSPQKNGANLPPTGQFALQNKLDLALWAFRPQKFLKLPGTIGFNILTQWLNVGYFQYIRLQGKFKYFTNNINDISIFISYNKVHPDMWHNQLYSIHTHIYIYPSMSYYYLLYPTSIWDSPADQLRCRCATGCWSPRPRTARSRAESGSPTLSKSGPGNEHLGSQLFGAAPAKLLQKDLVM
jgi:hypothetical protein